MREGSLEDRADPLFERYYGKLQCNTKLCTPEEVSEFKRIILEGINTRSRLELIEKSSLLYRLVSREEDKSDAVFACIGIFLTVLKFYELDVKKAKEDFQIRTLFEPLSTYHDKRGGAIPMGLAHLREKYTPDTSEEDLSPTGTKYMHHMRRAETQMRVDCPDIWGILLASYRAILGFEGDLWYKGSRIDLYIKPFVLRYWKLLETIA